MHPLLPYWGTVLKSRLEGHGRRGAAEGAADQGRRHLRRDHRVAAVKALQKAAKLTQTGVVGTVTWKAVEARMPR